MAKATTQTEAESTGLVTGDQALAEVNALTYFANGLYHGLFVEDMGRLSWHDKYILTCGGTGSSVFRRLPQDEATPKWPPAGRPRKRPSHSRSTSGDRWKPTATVG